MGAILPHPRVKCNLALKKFSVFSGLAALKPYLQSIKSLAGPMIRITITAAVAAIERALPAGNVGYERAADDTTDRQIWLESHIVNRLRYLRGPGESFSVGITRWAGAP